MEVDHPSVWLIALAVLCGLIALVTGIQIWRAQLETAKAVRERIATIGNPGPQVEELLSDRRRLSRVESLDRSLRRVWVAQRLDRLLLGAGVQVRLDAFLVQCVTAAALVAVVLRFVTPSAPAVLAGAALTVCLPLVYLSITKRRRIARFEQQLPDVLDFISRAMQAGHAFGIAMQMAASEAPQPIGAEFARAQAELNHGVPVQKALSDLAGRIDSTDLNFFAVAVSINREVGGDLAGLLGNLASLIRSRIEMRASVQAMTAEGRLSAKILVALPFVIAGVLFLLQPKMISVLWTTELGRDLLAAAGLLMVLGILWMNRITQIRV